MGLIQKIKEIFASLRATGGLQLPDAGRSSEETLGKSMSNYLTRYSTISPIISFEALKTLKYFWLYNPDFSQYVANIQNLANTGHQVTVNAKTDSQAEAALKRINETAARIYSNAAGVDGLLNGYLAQIAWSGALSSEDVVNFAGKRIEQVVMVPVEQIRFKYNQELGRYIPFQKSTNYLKTAKDFGLVELHPETYRYFALQTIENSPYAKPPASAVIDAICDQQKPIFENIQYIAQKFGLMGMTTASVAPPPKKANETDQEYQSRATSYLKLVASRLEGMFRKGLLVTFRDQKIEHTNIAESAAGVYEVNRMSEEQVMSALGMQPAFFGRTDSTTETFADVVYSLLSANVHNVQILPKRRMEQTYRLDLRLGGLEVDSVSLKFNRTFSRNILQEAQTNQMNLQVVLEKVRSGVISPDQGAQELGYESWYDEELITNEPSVAQLFRSMPKTQVQKFSFKFNKDAQRYEFVRPQISLAADSEDDETSNGNVIPILKKKAMQD
jgi:hypothetical protein